MPAERLSMRKIREVLRLKFGCGLSNRAIAKSVSISRSVVADYLLRASAAGLSWPQAGEMDETTLDHLFFPPVIGKKQRDRAHPDWAEVHRELKGKGVTLALLWQEYKENNPEGYQYSWFCQSYEKWHGAIDPVMRQNYRAGEKLFVDYTGQTVVVIDPQTGEEKVAQIFVAALGASNYIHAEATWTQGLSDWIGSHVRAFAAIGGVPEMVIPDNLKSGVTKACYYEPDINPTYQDMASHYGIAILPARVKAPRDKAKVETAVQIVERQILARFRHHTFFSLTELNQEIARLLVELNNKPFQKLPGTRQSLLESLERPTLGSLPVAPYQYAEWKKATVHIDYHLEIDGHYYSVPYHLIGQKLDARITSSTVEFFRKGKRVASHPRQHNKGCHSTIKEHMPEKHQRYLEWTPERFRRWAEKIGPHTALLTDKILAARKHPQQAYRSLLGIFRLGKSYSDHRLDAACARALSIGSTSYSSIESILKSGLDGKPVADHAGQDRTCPA